MKIYYILLISILCLISCKKDGGQIADLRDANLAFDTIPKVWKRYYTPDNEQFSVLKMRVINNKLVFVTPTHICEMDTNQILTRYQKYEGIPLREPNEVFMNDKYIAHYTYRNGIVITTLENPNIKMSIKLSDIGNYYWLYKSDITEPCFITNNDKLIITLKRNGDDRNYYIAVLQINRTAQGLSYTLEREIPIDRGNYLYSFSVALICADNSNPNIVQVFDEKLREINLTTGEVRSSITVNAQSCIQKQDTTWVFGFLQHNEYKTAIFYKTKNSNSWASITAERYDTYATWHNINNQFIILTKYNNARLSHFTLDINKKMFYEKRVYTGLLLDFKDIIEFNKQVYIASRQGLLSQSVNTFLEDKIR